MRLTWSTSAKTWVVVATLTLLSGCVDGDGGELIRDESTTVSLPVRPGVAVVWGAITVTNSGNQAVVLGAGRLVKSRGLRVRRVMAAGPRRGYPLFPAFESPHVYGRRYSFHPDRWKPIMGFEVPPASTLAKAKHDDVQIIFEFQPVKAGHYEALGAEIDYDDGGDTRTLDLDDEVVICAPRGCKLRKPSSD